MEAPEYVTRQERREQRRAKQRKPRRMVVQGRGYVQAYRDQLAAQQRRGH